MGATTGPCFAMYGTAPADWNRVGLLSDTQVAFSHDNKASVLEVHSRSFKEKLLTGETQWVFVAHVVREDAEQYFAFSSPAERALFLEFRELDSVGPKTAAQLLGALDMSRLNDLIQGRSLTGLKIPGVGPKTLEKVAQGVKSGKEKFLRIWTAIESAGGAEGAVRFEEVPSLVVQGLEKLGLRREEVLRLCRELADGAESVESWTSAEWIRRALQLWGQRKSMGKIQVSPIEGNS